MTIIAIDCHVFGESWFASVAKDLINSNKSKVAYSNHFKFQSESGKKAAQFYKLVGDKKKRVDADELAVATLIEDLAKDPSFVAFQECDDPHMFALLFVTGGSYLFSMDKRLCTCRNKLSGTKMKKYSNFKVLSGSVVYGKHRNNII